MMSRKAAIRAIAFAALALAGAARAEEPSGCEAFKWPSRRQQAALAPAGRPSRTAARSRRTARGRKISRRLKRSIFRMPPERAATARNFRAPC